MLTKIYNLMQNNNINAYTLEKNCGLSNSTFTSWKRGKAKPSLDAIIKIAKYFNVSIDYLVDYDVSSFSQNMAKDNNLEIEKNELSQNMAKLSDNEEHLLELFNSFDDWNKIKLLKLAETFKVEQDKVSKIMEDYREDKNTTKKSI